MQQKKPIKVMINFNDTYQLMKSYLSKKRFSYVYQQAIKYYKKNQSQFSNHEVIKIIQLIFYVLQKKIMSKVSPFLKNVSLDSIQQLYQIMSNVYLTWQNALILQLNVQNPQFFHMFFRHYKARNMKKILGAEIYLFEAKKDYIIPQKNSSQFRLYFFFRRCLKMTIYSLMQMIFTTSTSRIKQMIVMVIKGEKVFNKFQQAYFPVEKAQFFILKCQIIDIIKEAYQELQLFQIKYQLPLGLLGLIYKNFYKWNQQKLCHYIKLLLRVIYFSLKNNAIEIKDAYILASEINLLINLTKSKQSKNDDKQKCTKKKQQGKLNQNNMNSNGNKSNNYSYNKSKQSQQNSRNLDPHTTNKNNNNTKKSYNQFRIKNRHSIALQTIISLIQSYIQSRKQVQIIIRSYMQDVYYRYKSVNKRQLLQNKNYNVNQDNLVDQIIDEIPLLCEKDYKKGKKQKDYQNHKNSYNNQGNYLFDSTPPGKGGFNVYKKQSHINQDQFRIMPLYSNSNSKKKQNKIIFKNIQNIKNYQKKLKIQQNNQQNQTKSKNNCNNLTKDTLNIKNDQQIDQSSKIHKLNYEQFCNKIKIRTLKTINNFSINPSKQINFFDESDIDSNQQQEENIEINTNKFKYKYKFEQKRYQMILNKNNSYFRGENPNYNMNKSLINNTQRDNLNNNNNCNDNDSINQQNNQCYNSNKTNRKKSSDSKHKSIKNKKIGDDFMFEQIKLLDQVIQDKIFNYINLQPQNYKSSRSSYQSNDRMIDSYSKAMYKTQKLQNQVDYYNSQKHLLFQKLTYRKNLDHRKEYYNQSNNQHDDIEESHLRFHQISRDLQLLYNSKNNIVYNTVNFIQEQKKLMNIDKGSISKNIILNQAIYKYSKTYKDKVNLPIIGEAQQKLQNSFNKKQIPIMEYIIENRPISLLEQILKEKQQEKKFKYQGNMEKKQIALRETFDGLRGNISKIQFNQQNSLTKGFMFKVNK